MSFLPKTSSDWMHLIAGMIIGMVFCLVMFASVRASETERYREAYLRGESDAAQHFAREMYSEITREKHSEDFRSVAFRPPNPSFLAACLKANPKMANPNMQIEAVYWFCTGWNALQSGKYSYPIKAHQGWRTPEQQNKLFKKGFSKLDGYKKKSNHQSGFAFDFSVCADVECKRQWFGNNEKEKLALAYGAGFLMMTWRYLQERYQSFFRFDELESRGGIAWTCSHKADGWDMAHLELGFPSALPKECRKNWTKGGTSL